MGLDIIEKENDYTRLAISSVQFFWPNKYNSKSLAWLYAEIFYPWENNPSSYAHPKIKLDQYDWVIDAGACEGFYTRYALNENAKKIIAIEPLPLLSDALGMTFSDEISKGIVHIASCALGDKSKATQLDVNVERVCDACINENGDTGVNVEVMTLDSVYEEYSLEGTGVIKMDIEGAEMAAIKGAAKVLTSVKPVLAIAVYHDYENAMKCREMILESNPDYHVEFRGMYCYYNPPRPYLLFAW